ncbi:MAG: glucosaminidase domain-containing protein [Erysipelotrichaceae bacterium]|nr:glucosaminidase domain-containing protein [Erysipelotrichaceae bacterium]
MKRNLYLKTTSVIISTIMIMFMSLFTHVLNVRAEGNFVVKDIATNGEVTTIDSYATFDQAYSVMLNYQNGVITHQASLSPTKIIAMTRGIAVSYSFRYGSLTDGVYKTNQTMTITQFATNILNQKDTYVASHYDMQYINTVSYNEANGNGRVHVVMAGFDGYADLHQLDLIPLVYLENNLSIQLGGNTFDPNYEYAFTLEAPKQVQYIVSGNEVIFQRWSFYSGIIRNNVAIGLKADWMVDGAIYYSYDLNTFYHDRALTDLAGVYYNYYQYLPLRSKTNISTAQLNAYLLTKKDSGLMKDNGNLFINAQNTYGVNALLLYAIAAQESNYGTSAIALRTNNLFGINAIDSDPSQATTFPDVEACVNDMAGWFLRRYMDINDWRFFGSHLGTKESGFNVKYASDPYWGLQIAAIAYNIDRTYDLVDYQYYGVGVINEYNVSIKKEANATSANWYTSAYGATYQQDFTVILNQIDNGFYQIPTTNPITGGVMTSLNTTREIYGFIESIGYIDTSKITLLSNSRYYETLGLNPITSVLYPEYITDGNVLKINNFSFDTNGLDVSGFGFNKGIGIFNSTNVNHSLVFVNTETSVETTFALDDDVANTTIDQTYPIKDLSFSSSTFKKDNIDLSSLANGEYEVLIRVSYNRFLEPFDVNINLETIPDISAITSALVFSELEDKLYLAVNRKIEKQVLTDIDVFTWGTEEQSELLFIQGVAALKGINHNDRDKITHRLIIYNIDTLEEYEYQLDTYNNNELDTYLFSIGDDANYYYSWFSNYIDVSELPIGDYRANLEVEIISSTGDLTYYGKKQLMNNLVGNIPVIKTINDKTFIINKNGRFVSRYELSIIDGLDEEYAQVRKPTNRLTNFNIDNFEINDSILSGIGFMYMFYTDHNDSQKPTYKLYFVKNGNIVQENELSTITGPYELTSIINSIHNYSKAWFSFDDIDLSELDEGTYDVYISISCGDYFDIIQMFDYFKSINETYTNSNRIYEVVVMIKNYDKVKLIITNID